MIIKGKWGNGRKMDGNPLYDTLMMDAIMKMSIGGDVTLEGVLSLAPEEIEDLTIGMLIDSLVLLQRYTKDKPMVECQKELALACDIADELVDRAGEGGMMIGDPGDISDVLGGLVDLLMDDYEDDDEDDYDDEYDEEDSELEDSRLENNEFEDYGFGDDEDDYEDNDDDDIDIFSGRPGYPGADRRSPVRALAHSFLEEYVNLRGMSENREIQEETADMMLRDGIDLESEDSSWGGMSADREDLIRRIAADAKRDAERMYSVAEFLLMYDNMGDMLRGER